MIEKINTGIVMEVKDFEDEHIVKILTEGGNLLSLKAKGLDNFISKNRVSIKIFNKINVEFFTSSSSIYNTGRLKRSSVIHEFKEYNEYSINLVESIRNIIIDQNFNSILTYKILERLIFEIEEDDYKFQTLLSLMIVTLRQNGYTPIIDKCVKCGSNQKINAFEIYEGGLICDNHDEGFKYELSESTLRKIIEINSLKNPVECRNLNFTPEEKTKIQSMYKAFMENQLGINLYTLKNV